MGNIGLQAKLRIMVGKYRLQAELRKVVRKLDWQEELSIVVGKHRLAGRVENSVWET